MRIIVDIMTGKIAGNVGDVGFSNCFPGHKSAGSADAHFGAAAAKLVTQGQALLRVGGDEAAAGGVRSFFDTMRSAPVIHWQFRKRLRVAAAFLAEADREAAERDRKPSLMPPLRADG